jgi:outer membrane immunogenic protein
VNASASLPPYNAPLCLFRDLFLIFVSSQPHFTIKAAPLTRHRLLDLEALCTFALRSVSLGVESMWNLSKRILGAALAGAVGFSGANAADMYVGGGSLKDPVYIAPTWAGFYLGANAGFGISDISHSSSEQVPSDLGFAGGGQIGYNFQRGSFVFGVEADISGLSLDATKPCANPAFKCSAKEDWMATVRGRVGYAFDRTLLYATGGVAFSELNAETSLGGVHFKDDKSLTGYAVGGGIEYQFTPKWIGRAEYLYTNYGSDTYHFDVPYKDVETSIQQVRLGMSYKVGPAYESLK